MTNNRSRSLAVMAMLFLLTLGIGMPLLTHAQVAGHSAYVDLLRSIVWHNQVEQGVMAPRWIPDFYFGHGSPIFLFYAPASYVLVEMLRPLAGSAAGAIKLSYLFLIFLGLAGIYKLGKTISKNRHGGIAAAATMGLAPYFLVDLYVRNGIAEFAAFCILPWVFRAGICAATRGGNWALLWFALFYALLVMTHNITAMIASPILLALVIFCGIGRHLKTGLVALASGIGISSWFWLPALAEKNLVLSTESLTGGLFHYSNHFVNIGQLFWSPWGFGSSLPGPDDEMSLQAGPLLWIVVIIAAVFLIIGRKRIEPAKVRLMSIFLGAFGVCLLFTTALTEIFWDHLPLLPFVQFPWRFLLPATVCAAALAAFLPDLITDKRKSEKINLLVAVLIVFVAALSAFGHVRARYVLHNIETNNMVIFTEPEKRAALLETGTLRDPESIFTIENIRLAGVTTTAQNDYLPQTVTTGPGGRYYGFLVETEKGQVDILRKKMIGASIQFEYEAKEPATVRLEQFYFPGWTARGKDGSELEVHPKQGNGWMLIDLPAGEDTVTVSFEDTRVRKFGKILSIVTLLAVGVWLTLRQNPKEEQEGG